MKKQLLLSTAVIALAGITPALAGPPVYSWTGWYAGGNVGYSWGTGAPTYTEVPVRGPATITGSSHLTGGIGGGQAGYNWQLNSWWVTGLEVDLQESGERSGWGSFLRLPNLNAGEGVAASLHSSIDWFGTVRGQVGWLYNPTTMVYATGGLAYGRVTTSGNFASPPSSGTWGYSQARTNVGWTVGGGIEGAFPVWSNWNVTNWTWKIEYLYLDLGSLTGNGIDIFSLPYTYNVKFTDNILRFGLNWHFH